MKNIHLLIVCPDPMDGTSYYRCYGPLMSLQKKWPELTLIAAPGNPNDYSWATMRQVDAVFFQRPALEAHAKLIEMAKEHRLKVWVDYDDLLTEVPEDNPAYETYGKIEIKNAVKICLQSADIVTVSTQALKEKFSEFNTNIQVIPNAFDDQWLRPFPTKLKKAKKRVLWRGSKTHQRDLYEVREDIISASHDFPDWEFVFVGYNPWFITSEMREDSWSHIPLLPMIRYLDSIKFIQAEFQINPLTDHAFNHCKSNIGWIEGTYAGSPVLAPDWPEWQHAVTYKPGQFKSKLYEMFQCSEEFYPAQAMSWQYIKDNLFLTQVNEQRKMLIESLV